MNYFGKQELIHGVLGISSSACQKKKKNTIAKVCKSNTIIIDTIVNVINCNKEIKKLLSIMQTFRNTLAIDVTSYKGGFLRGTGLQISDAIAEQELYYSRQKPLLIPHMLYSEDMWKKEIIN